MKKSRVNFALCWHMHQPWYQKGIDGEYFLPWVYLHAIKDYSDMIFHLENHPKMKVVVNFAPVLLEQLDDYSHQLTAWLEHGNKMNDPMLNLLAGVDEVPSEADPRYRLLCDCQRAYAPKMIDPYPAFRDLLALAKSTIPDGHCAPEDQEMMLYFDEQYFVDLLVWYHIAWLGHSLKQTSTSKRLIKKARQFDLKDRRDLIELIHDCVSNLISRYRKLAESGQIELSMTPYGHPIIPLLNDIENMNCSQPGSAKPECKKYPGGEERSAWHIEKGIECFENYFGFRPKGIWLSEGAISEDAVALIERYGFTWTASGEGVWSNSVHLSEHSTENIHNKRALFHPYTIDHLEPKVFFRDDGLSDLIGFEYSGRDSVESADDLVQHLVNIADFLGDDAEDHVVSIILDGENAWEYYPHNGFHFLDSLYEKLSGHDRINTDYFSAFTDNKLCKNLERLCPGSWVYGSFSTWIGEEDKNKAWDLLSASKLVFDEVIASDSLTEEEQALAIKQLAICEGSDWFWWFGKYNASDSVQDFDRLYREQLKNLYTFLKRTPPDTLDVPISIGGGDAENAGTMRRNVG